MLHGPGREVGDGDLVELRQVVVHVELALETLRHGLPDSQRVLRLRNLVRRRPNLMLKRPERQKKRTFCVVLGTRFHGTTSELNFTILNCLSFLLWISNQCAYHRINALMHEKHINFGLYLRKHEGTFLSARNNMITVSTFCTSD